MTTDTATSVRPPLLLTVIVAFVCAALGSFVGRQTAPDSTAEACNNAVDLAVRMSVDTDDVMRWTLPLAEARTACED